MSNRIAESKTVSRSAVITGILLIITSAIHALDINDTVIAVKTGDIAQSHAASAISVWIFSGIAMLLIGIWLLFLAKDLRSLQRRAWWQALFIALGLAGFSLGSWLQFPKAFHLLYFLLLALLLLIPLLMNSRKFFRKNLL
jgi:hypothetical protein